MRANPLTVFEIEYIAFTLARDLLALNEPIPELSTRFPHRLESCLAVPFQSFGKKAFFPTLVSKAAIIFYLLIKNYPFQNGNKRIAVTTLFVFLHLNGKWLKVHPEELLNFAIWVAASPHDYRDEVVKAIEKFIQKHLVKKEVKL